MNGGICYVKKEKRESESLGSFRTEYCICKCTCIHRIHCVDGLILLYEGSIFFVLLYGDKREFVAVASLLLSFFVCLLVCSWFKTSLVYTVLYSTLLYEYCRLGICYLHSKRGWWCYFHSKATSDNGSFHSFDVVSSKCSHAPMIMEGF